MMRQSINKKIILYALVLLILSTITNKKLSFTVFNLNEFDIIGLNKLETQKVYNDLKVFKNSNIFTLKKKEILETIYSHNIIQEFYVNKKYPSTLNIEIQKTNFLGITKKNKIDYMIGENGNLIELTDTNLDLPYIFGNVDIDKFLRFKKIIDNSNLNFSSFKSLYYFKSNRWDILFKNGLILKLPITLDAEKINLVFEIINNNNFNKAKIIDFRQDYMMIIDE
jgi:cell division protein FtsQ